MVSGMHARLYRDECTPLENKECFTKDLRILDRRMERLVLVAETNASLIFDLTQLSGRTCPQGWCTGTCQGKSKTSDG